MTIDSNHILTKDKIVLSGGLYQYKEDHHIADVMVVSITNNAEGFGFTLKVQKVLSGAFKEGEEFKCWASHEKCAYSGMWRLLDLESYITT